MEKQFLLYACCIPVKGARRSVICDLQRSKYYFIPGALYEILVNYAGLSPNAIKEKFNRQNDETIDEYFEYLVNNELGFYTDEPERFPLLNLSWKSPLKVTNAIVDISADSDYDHKKVLEELDTLGCGTIQFRFYDKISYEALDNLLETCLKSRVRCIELLLPYSRVFGAGTLKKLCKKHTRIIHIVFHSSACANNVYHKELKVIVTNIKSRIDSSSHCGIIHPAHFRTDIGIFTESQSFNSCLNRKISVDVNGEIRNCPSHPVSYGNISNTMLSDVIARQEFTRIWQISKDEVKVCKDCEFRYICTDCRVFTTDEDPLGKPAKCSYDPYTACWTKEGDNPLSREYTKMPIETK
jgi:SPASM domain peptide maturase of grasp-with-spasm system